MSYASQVAALNRRGLARSSATHGTSCTLRKVTLGAHNVAADTAVSSTTDHALTGVLVTGWKNTRFERRGWMRVRQVIIPLASLPDGVVPTETDTLLFDGAEWTIVELEHPVPAAGYLLNVVVT